MEEEEVQRQKEDTQRDGSRGEESGGGEERGSGVGGKEKNKVRNMEIQILINTQTAQSVRVEFSE